MQEMELTCRNMVLQEIEKSKPESEMMRKMLISAVHAMPGVYPVGERVKKTGDCGSSADWYGLVEEFSGRMDIGSSERQTSKGQG